MEDILKRLLDTEHKAEVLVDTAHAERDRILDAAQRCCISAAFPWGWRDGVNLRAEFKPRRH